MQNKFLSKNDKDVQEMKQNIETVKRVFKQPLDIYDMVYNLANILIESNDLSKSTKKKIEELLKE